jgi:predicted lipid-binding transport protein (Tim44 family)
MISRRLTYFGAMVLAGVVSLSAGGAGALTMRECSSKYKAAQAAGSLGGKTWNQFRKEECGSTATAAPASTPAAQEKEKTAPAKVATPAAPASNAVFPSAVAPKFSSEAAGKARMHTCLEQYKANKASNNNGGLKWIQKGGGYYSECNKHLKG